MQTKPAKQLVVVAQGCPGDPGTMGAGAVHFPLVQIKPNKQSFAVVHTSPLFLPVPEWQTPLESQNVFLAHSLLLVHFSPVAFPVSLIAKYQITHAITAIIMIIIKIMRNHTHPDICEVDLSKSCLS